MKSPFAFICKAKDNKRYANTKDIGGIEFVVSTSIEDHKFSNREAEVVVLPSKYKGPVQVGDTLLVHHNVFKYYNDMKGKQRSGRSFFKDDLFFVEDEQYYAYKHDGKQNAINRYCFIKPVPVEESYIYKPFTEEPLLGEMMYPNKYLLNKGVKKGTKVSFQPNTEYEFEIEGEKVYRMFDHHITMTL